VPVADARGYISSKLREMKSQQQSQEYAKKLLADSGVTYHFVLVDPPAQVDQGQGAPDGASQPPPAAPDSSASTPPAAAPAPAGGSAPQK
jgi:hypothetical protein